MKLPRIARDEPGRPGKYPQGSPKAISGSKTAIGVKSGNPKIGPSGPSPGTSGASRNPLDLPSRAARALPDASGSFLTWCEALFLHFASLRKSGVPNQPLDPAGCLGKFGLR